MKKYTLLVILLLSVFSAIGQSKIKGNRSVTEEERVFDYFSKLEVNDKIELTLKQGSENKLEIEADENLHDVLDADVRNSVLTLSLNKRITSSKRFNLVLYVEDLDQITLNDDSEVTSDEKLDFFNLEMILNDKSDIELKNLHAKFLDLQTNERSRSDMIIRTDSLVVTAKESSKSKLDIVTQSISMNYSGSATIEALGKTNNLSLNAGDNAAFKGAELTADIVYVDALDKTDTYVNARESIFISAKNKAEVYIFNKPEITLTLFEDNASLYKRESMKLLENL